MRLWPTALGIGLLALFGATLPTRPTGAQSRRPADPEFRLSPRSPLATDGRTLIAVADDDRTILTRSFSERAWTLSGGAVSPGPIAAMTIAPQGLIVADRTGTTWLWQDKAFTKLTHTPAAGISSLAWAGDQLFAGDAASGSVLRLDLFGGDHRPIPLPRTALGPIHLATAESSLIVGAEANGDILQVNVIGSIESASRQYQWLPWLTPPTSPTKIVTAAPRTLDPKAIAAYRGSVYVLDGTTRELFVSYRHGEFLRIRTPHRVAAPGSILVSEEALVVLDGPLGRTEQWSRYVPVRVDLGSAPREAAEAVIKFLYEIDALAVRMAPWEGTMTDTLRASGWALGDPTPGLEAIICFHSAVACADPNAPGSGPARGTPFPIPEIVSSRSIALETLEAERLGSKTLGEWVDARILTPAFSSYATESRLRSLNSSLPADAVPAAGFRALNAETLRSIGAQGWSGGRLTVPVEKIQLLITAPIDQLRDLTALAERSPGMRVTLLQDGDRKASDPRPLQTPSPSATAAPAAAALTPTLADVRSRMSDLQTNIHATTLSPMLGRIAIGIAEGDIDYSHPEFGPNTFQYVPSRPPVNTATAAPPGAAPGVSLRPADHGTAVAALIAAGGQAITGLAPNAVLIPLPDRDPALSTAISEAYAEHDARIFNLSLHLKNDLPEGLRQSVRLSALFIVAAGNDNDDSEESGAICDMNKPWPAYPVCEGARKNVIVVGATDIHGNSLIPPSGGEKGSNWNEHLVSIAAPGEGYYSASAGNAYGTVKGTSFAAPLVTATAARLAAAKVTDPWLIKQRIIATADRKSLLVGRVLGGGLLNVSRAVSFPHNAVLTSSTNTEQVADLVSGQSIEIKWQGERRTLSLAQVRRLSRSGAGIFRIVYHDKATDSLILQDNVERTSPNGWVFKYFPVASNGTTGAQQEANLASLKDYVGPMPR